MNVVLRTGDRAHISLDGEELLAMSNELNEVCNGVHLSEPEFSTRMGVDRQAAAATLAGLQAALGMPHSELERCDTWSDTGSVMVKAITVYGDPVELGEQQAKDFLAAIASAVEESK